MGKKIDDYKFPEDLKEMNYNEMDLLTYSIRDFLIEKISSTGGHLASNLGVVELTLALHKVFDSPRDKIVWDVGHQSYVHKILTGRSKDFDSLRQFGGLSGFPKREESKHDIFDVGHASTSISAASGIASARDIKGEDYNVIAVIGDGSLTGGLAYEGLNNLGISKSKMIVVLNDNEMSISKNIGGISEHLNKLRTSSKYLETKKTIKRIVDRIPYIGGDLHGAIVSAKDRVKYAVVPFGVLFEELGLKYIGPIDGHNIKDLVESLNRAKNIDGPVLLHVITKKGKGYRQAEQNPGKYHGIGAFDAETGVPYGKTTTTFSSVFGKTMVEMAKEKDNIVCISAAMCDATGLKKFGETFPKRFFDVGIAEAHGVTFSAGLALNGMKPYVAIYSSFLQRAYDQILEDVCLQNLPVVFALDRAGIVGADGETHHGIFDLSYLMTAPNMTIYTPCDKKTLEDCLKSSYYIDGPVAIRYPRGACEEDLIGEDFQGENLVLLRGRDVQLLCVGSTLKEGLKAVEILKNKGINGGITFVGKVKDGKNTRSKEDRLKELGLDKKFTDRRNRLVVTLEDNIETSGFGTNLKAELDLKNALVVGWPDKFIEHGDVENLRRKYKLDAEGIVERIVERIERKA